MPPEVSFVLYPRPLGSRGAYHDSRISAKSMLHLGPEYHDRVNYRVHVKFLSNLERWGGFDTPSTGGARVSCLERPPHFSISLLLIVYQTL